MDKQLPKPEDLVVKTPDSIRSGVYANVTNINVTPNEVVINFVYANPSDTPQGTLVSRVIVSRQHAEQIAKLFRDAIETANELDPK